jgi:hypothetical protein
MDWLKYQDCLIFVVVPLVMLTTGEVMKNWRSLFDDNLTSNDRQLLMRTALFLLLPVVVFFHELGHALAILFFGGKVAEFHYGLLWGYVVPSGMFTPEQILIIYLAGNVVEMLIGFLSLILAAFTSSPPLVALFTYLGLWSIGGTAIIYTLMSLVGMYGDWQAIYSSQLHSWTSIIALCHIAIVAFFLYIIYGNGPRLWFARRTNPHWYKLHQPLEALANTHPTAENYLELAWSYYRVGLYDQAEKALDQARAIDPHRPDIFYLLGWLMEGKGKTTEAIAYFNQVTNNKEASDSLRFQSFIAIGHLLSSKLSNIRTRVGETNNLWQEAMDSYTEAIALRPDLADPHLFRARLLKMAGMDKEARSELAFVSNLAWLDPQLKNVPEAE